MSLLNLKRTSPLDSKPDCDVDAFINGAVAYGAGQSTVVALHGGQGGRVRRCKRATFTLSEEAIERLALLSRRTGIPKSRLIRIWLDQVDWNRDLERLIASPVP
ncbi:ribbon-helix-helix domain-containing protein [Ferrimonas balearica]|uniref:ribbon-helix-helix domain-containing protein n=1 Tax=Ferrimonas balearica TaxID=44012 RepID=UPI001C99877C|nr:ribbon-helix-helix domain-containing protein [Ferrimonas balearica]MBY5993895.1 ribbon-helix-helix domain-containing protein [Ferrimonas balearica]